MVQTTIIETAKDIPLAWDDIAGSDILLKRNYLQALQQSLPKNITHYYLVQYVGKEVVGIALVQLVSVDLKAMLREPMGSWAKRFLVKGMVNFLKGKILVVGNLTHTGQHAVALNRERISLGEFTQHLFQGLLQLRALLKKNNITIGAYLLKDFYSSDQFSLKESVLNYIRIYKVEVQPNMIFQIDSRWNNLDDYYVALNKKYKRRYRTAVKKLGGILEKNLDFTDVYDNKKELHNLYLNVSTRAKFNSFELPENHFFHLKKRLEQKFIIRAFIHQNKIIGFYSMIENGGDLETYFLGYDHDYQYSRQLYLNMLYRMVEYGIENNFQRIIFARTAIEIKSSIGAKPHRMVMYMAHTNKYLNWLFKPVFNMINPNINWDERHPFSRDS